MQNTEYQYGMGRGENRDKEWVFMLGQIAVLYKWFRPILSNNVGTSHVTIERLKWGQYKLKWALSVNIHWCLNTFY